MDALEAPLLQSGRDEALRHRKLAGLKHGRLHRLSISQRIFFLLVLLPTLLSAIYYFGFAADQYESEARFLIYSAEGPPMQMSGLGQMLGLGAGGGDSSSQTFSVIDYMQSHDAVADLRQKIDLVEMFRRPQADLLSRLWSPDPTAEHLLRYYNRKVTLTYRDETGITTLDVHAFRPEDALLIASTLLKLGEDRVNAYNSRVTADTEKVAQDEVSNAEARIEASEAAVTSFREQHSDVDPELTSSASMALIAELNGQLTQDQALLAQMSGYLSPDSPQMITLRSRVAALQQRVVAQTALLTGPQSGELAPELSKYQDLTMRLQFAQQNYTAAQAALETAREDALKQQLFLIQVVQPNLPQTALFPRRVMIVSSIFAVLLVAYGIGWLMAAGVREHAM